MHSKRFFKGHNRAFRFSLHLKVGKQ